MSEFKFACPVCGQHITCDSSSSGKQMDCPTCFRKLIVPQPSAVGSPGLVLTASEVPTRQVPLPSQEAAADLVSRRPRKKSPIAALIFWVLICAVGAGVFIFRDKLFHSIAPGTNGPGLAAKNTNASTGLLPTSTNWTLNLATATIPDSPASGSVMGRSFTLDRAVMHGGKLDLRQGPKWPPDVGLSIHLFADRAEDLAGRTVILESTRTNAPRVILRSKEAPNASDTNAQEKVVTKDFNQGYAARVVFGAVTGKRLEGKIYIATPDDAKSYVAGTFSAEIRTLKK